MSVICFHHILLPFLFDDMMMGIIIIIFTNIFKNIFLYLNIWLIKWKDLLMVLLF